MSRVNKSGVLIRKNAFSLMEVLIATAILSIIGGIIATLIADSAKIYRRTDTDQSITYFTQLIQKSINRNADCASPSGGLLNLNIGSATTTTPVLIPAAGLVNTTTPGVCGSLPCTLTVGDAEPILNRFRVNRMFINNYPVAGAGCDLALPGLQCAQVNLNIEYMNINSDGTSGTTTVRSIPLIVRTTATNQIARCYTSPDIASFDGYVNTGGDTMTGTLTVTTPAFGIGLSVTNGFVQANHFIASSDKRLKHNINQIPHPLETLLKIKGVQFNWNIDNSKDWGFIAQDLEKVVPFAVKTDKQTGFKAVNYNSIIPLLVEVANSLEKENQKLKEQIIQLKHQIDSKNYK
ncbi:MAG: tail fiber domain-containing protein [Pseudobdellovibrio sp.]